MVMFYTFARIKHRIHNKIRFQFPALHQGYSLWLMKLIMMNVYILMPLYKFLTSQKYTIVWLYQSSVLDSTTFKGMYMKTVE